jgi:hypothetical protein
MLDHRRPAELHIFDSNARKNIAKARGCVLYFTGDHSFTEPDFYSCSDMHGIDAVHSYE